MSCFACWPSSANTTLEQDKATVLRCWLAMGGKEDDLRRRYYVRDLGKWKMKMRDEVSDDVTEWCGVTVKGGRVAKLYWGSQGLSGSIPAEIGALSALTTLLLIDNKLHGAVPSTIGALSSLAELDLRYNLLSGVVPYSFSNPTVVKTMSASEPSAPIIQSPLLITLEQDKATVLRCWLAVLSLGINHLAELPHELGNLRSLTGLTLNDNRLSELPSTLANLTNLDGLSLYNNNFTFDVPSSYMCEDKEWIQSFLTWLKNPDSEFPLFDESEPPQYDDFEDDDFDGFGSGPDY